MNIAGKNTRAKLLEAATKIFSERGFEGVSTRDIAAAAGTSSPAIAYHFGSKQGLYAAVLATIAQEVETQLTPVITEISAALAQPRITHAQALEALQRLFRALARVMLRNGCPTALIARDYLQSTRTPPASERLLVELVCSLITRLIGLLRKLPPDKEFVELEAMMLTRWLLNLGFFVLPSCGRPNPNRLTAARVDRLVDLLREEIAVLFDPHDES